MESAAGSAFFRIDRLVDEAVSRHGLLAAGDAVLVGVSGGPDSVALLRLLQVRAPRWGLRLGVAHLDHLLREESGRDAEFVRRLSGDGGLPFYTEAVDVRELRRRRRTSLEEAARAARYRFFESVAGRHGYRKIALGHHADDNAETLLLNLLRGSGRLGLAGMQAVRDERYIRPMIHACRADILEYLHACGARFLEDRTNRDRRFLRNRIRHDLIPLLERRYQPRMRAILSRTAEIFQSEEQWLDALTAPMIAQALVHSDPSRLELSADFLTRLPPAAARRVVRWALQGQQERPRRIGFAHVDQVLRLVRRRADAGPVRLPEGVRVRRCGDRLVVALADPNPAAAPDPAEPGDFRYELHGCGCLLIRETGDRLVLSEVDPAAARPLSSPQAVFLDREAVAFPLTVRNSRPGDRFSPLGAGGSQKLKKFFSDHKVPRDQRRRCPLLLARERIIWVAGHRIDERARLTPATRGVIRAELIVAKP
jgi:tRNA(Ile)-lysidine synthase